ncbi:hypothetical protein Glove_283g122 [Diversispora epigaea]|uniref:Protein kinase domain-containing protein n=1 Tax=Diversispora epigaea TaxID=1348612 RepID=A0A397I8Q3_9GLOM|nr:hypothetical protein Glove_283g122 [Diversispora epigaea]
MKCNKCNQIYGFGWCKSCIKNDFDKWTSGNETINKFIQDDQLSAKGFIKIIEWIPYDRLKSIKEISKGGFGTTYYAKWIDGPIYRWDTIKKRWGEHDVVLKKFDDANLNEDFLNEMSILLRSMKKGFDYSNYSTRIFGITKDSETDKYMMVLDYMPGGNLRSHLKNNFNNFNWENKLYYLWMLARSFENFHKLNIIHQDLHPGNMLSNNFRALSISDFGLSKIVGRNLKNPEKRNVFGVLPYIAPEVLCGEEYTKAADVYSFAVIAYEMITGFAPYYDIPHNKDLARQICDGLRLKIPFYTPKLITRVIMRCWDARITHRPTFEELHQELWEYYSDYKENDFKNYNEITIQIKQAEEISANQMTTTTPMDYKSHPEAIFTSRLLNYSNLPKPKNEEKFEKEFEKLTKSTSIYF